MAPPPEDADAAAVGGFVEVTGGKYKGRRCLVVGGTKEFWDLKLEGEAAEPSGSDTFRVKKSNVRKCNAAMVPRGAPIQEKEREREDSTASTTGSGSEDALCDSCSESASPSTPQDSPSRVEAVLKPHSLSILSWNTGKMSFMARHEEALGDHVDLIAEEIARSGIEVVVLQEVPKVKGPGRVRALRERLNGALLSGGAHGSTLFGEPAFSSASEAKGREIHALLCRAPVRLELTWTLSEVGDVSLTYPPLVSLLRDDRFSFEPLQRIVLTSVHTPGSADTERSLQRALEANRLLKDLPQKATDHFNDNEGLRFKDLPTRRKAEAAKACANPFILCGDFNIDFFKPECGGVRQDLRDELSQGLKFCPLPKVNRVEVEIDNYRNKDKDKGCWVGGAPSGRVTSAGRRCLDFFFWNADSAKRAEFAVRPLHLSSEALKKARHPGLSDHDAVVLEVREDRVHSLNPREASSQRLG